MKLSAAVHVEEGSNRSLGQQQKPRNPESLNIEDKTGIDCTKEHKKCDHYSERKKVYTKGVFSSENSSASTGKKGVLVYTKKLVFKGKEGKMHIHQRASKVFVGDPFAS